MSTPSYNRGSIPMTTKRETLKCVMCAPRYSSGWIPHQGYNGQPFYKIEVGTLRMLIYDPVLNFV